MNVEAFARVISCVLGSFKVKMSPQMLYGYFRVGELVIDLWLRNNLFWRS